MARFTSETAKKSAAKSAKKRAEAAKKRAEEKHASKRKVAVASENSSVNTEARPPSPRDRVIRKGRNMPRGVPFTKENASAMGKRGGAAKKRKIRLADIALAFSEQELPKGSKLQRSVKNVIADLDDTELTNGAAMIAALGTHAMKGDTRSFQILADLQEAALQEHEGQKDAWQTDYGILIAEPFLSAHRRIWTGGGGEFWFYGGRSSTKSSCISLEILGLMERDMHLSALVVVKNGNTIREGVMRQFLWALDKLDLTDEYDVGISPLAITKRVTGQVITFRGCDKAEKSKTLTAPVGTYYGLQWFEECDQLSGMQEIRTVQQTATRGAGEDAPFWRFYSFNPPRSRDSWANKVIEERKAQGFPVYKANYTDVPREWLPAQTIEDAKALAQIDPDSYRHEYLGEATGYGNEVFERVEVREITQEEALTVTSFLYGVDWGFSRDPFCWVRVGYSHKTRTLYITEEYSGLGLSNEESAAAVKERMGASFTTGYVEFEPEPYAEVYCDSAEPKSIADFKALGISAKGAPKQGAFNVRNSTKWLQQRAKIVVDPKCKLAAEEFLHYSYVISPDGEVSSQLKDADNHAIDAVRYACATLIDDPTTV